MFSRWMKITGVFASLTLILSACASTPTPAPTDTYPAPENTSAPAGLPNPASVYCEENGGTLDIREGEGGQIGICVFPDGSECEEWAYFRKECQPGSGATVYPAPDTILPAVEPPAATDEPLDLTQHQSDEAYGITFFAPTDYTFEAGDHTMIIRREGYKLFIGYQRTDEETIPFRSGMPSGEFRNAGTLKVGGTDFTKQELVDGGKVKVVQYGPAEVGNLRLVIYLDGEIPEGGTYADIDISPKVELEFEHIITSIQLGG